jgi:hypothetical protein
LNQKAAPEFSLRRRGHSPLLTALGELHGRNLASALMRSRVHNRTRDRGGKPIRLGVAVGIAPGPSGGTGGALQKIAADKLGASFFAIYECAPLVQ